MKIPQTGRMATRVQYTVVGAAHATVTTTVVNVAVPGAQVGDAVICNPRFLAADILLGVGIGIRAAYVSAANVVTIIIFNNGLVAQPQADRIADLMILPQAA